MSLGTPQGPGQVEGQGKVNAVPLGREERLLF